ncbi:hypothetical protein ACE6H2_006215 [Prunus campanulata]
MLHISDNSIGNTGKESPLKTHPCNRIPSKAAIASASQPPPWCAIRQASKGQRGDLRYGHDLVQCATEQGFEQQRGRVPVRV